MQSSSWRTRPPLDRYTEVDPDRLAKRPQREAFHPDHRRESQLLRFAELSAGSVVAATTPMQQMGVVLAQNHPSVSAFPDSTFGSACTSTFSRFAQRLLTLRPAHSRSHQIRDRYPGASDISSPPCLPRLLPAGAVAGRGLHPLDKRRLVTAHVESGHSQIGLSLICGNHRVRGLTSAPPSSIVYRSCWQRAVRRRTPWAPKKPRGERS